MKKISITLLLLITFFIVGYNLSANAQAEENLNNSLEQEQLALVETSYVYTFKGSAVSVDIEDKDYSLDEMNKIDADTKKNYPLANQLRSASKKYNCHSYAWHSQSTNNSYWMDDPSLYYTDGSYVEVTIPQIGDRICYFDENNDNLHSGIVTKVLSGSSNGVCGDSNLVMITSKWGNWGLYEHRGDQCPYTSYANGTADYVKYYRHFHENRYVWKTDTKHYKGCYCGEQMLEAHAVKKGTTTCILCGGKVSMGFEEITSLSLSLKRSKNGSYILPNGVIVLVDKDISAYLDNTLIFEKDKEFIMI